MEGVIPFMVDFMSSSVQAGNLQQRCSLAARFARKHFGMVVSAQQLQRDINGKRDMAVKRSRGGGEDSDGASEASAAEATGSGLKKKKPAGRGRGSQRHGE